MRIFVVSGGPGVGKTSLINELKKRGFIVLEEAARKLAEIDKRFIGKSIHEIEKKTFQDAIFDFQKLQLNKLINKSLKDKVFSDRGFPDTLAYYEISGYEIPEEKLEHAKNFRYEKAFILDFLDSCNKDYLRTESKHEQEMIHKKIIKVYKKLNYEIINVPAMELTERADFIINKIT